MTSKRKLVYMFVELSHVHKVQIAKELNLADGLTDFDDKEWANIFIEAEKQKKLEILWDKIVCKRQESFYGQIAKLQANPFVDR